MGPWVTDEVWQRLDPDVGGRRRRWVRRGWLAFILVTGLWIATNLVWTSELVQPRLALISPTDASRVERVGQAFRQQFLMANEGGFTTTVLEMTLAGPGLELLTVAGRGAAEPSPFPVTLRPGGVVGFVLTFRVSDCTAFDVTYPWPMRAIVERPWGEMAFDVAGSYQTSGSEEQLVDFWCGQ